MNLEELLKSSTVEKKPQPTTEPKQSPTVTTQFPKYTETVAKKPVEEQKKALSTFDKFALGVYNAVEKVKDVTKALPGEAKKLGVKKSLTSVATGVTRGITALPDVARDTVDMAERLVQKRIQSSLPVKILKNISPEYGNITDESIKKYVKSESNLKAGLDVFADSVKEWGEKQATSAEDYMKFTEEDKQNSFNQLTQSGGQMVSIMLPGLGAAGVAAKLGAVPKVASLYGATLSGVIESGMESGQVYDTVLKETGDKDKAGAAADGTFWSNVALNIATNKLSGIFDAKDGGLLKRQVYTQYSKNPSNVVKGITAIAKITKAGAQSYGAEGAQEAAQQIISNIATGRVWNDGVSEAFALGGIAGSAFGVGGEVLGTYNGNQNVMGTGVIPESTPGAKEEEQVVNAFEDVKEEPFVAELPKEDTEDFLSLAEDTAILLESQDPETVAKALQLSFGLSGAQSAQVLEAATNINNNNRQREEIATEQATAQADIISRVSQDALLNKIKTLENDIDTKTAKSTADALAAYFNPKKLSTEERLKIADQIANTPVARAIIEEYTGTPIENSEEVLKNLIAQNDVFRQTAEGEIISSLLAAQGAGVAQNVDTGDYRRFSSGLPSWIPSEFKTVALTNKVAQYFNKGTLPPKSATRERALYDIIKEQIDATAKFNKEVRTYKISELGNGVEFNVKSNANIEKATLSNIEALAAVREYFTAQEVPVVFVDKIRTPRGTEAWGAYANGVIRLSNNTTKDTPEHESVHAFLDLFVAPQKKDKYLSEALKSYRLAHGEAKLQKEIANIQKTYGEKMTAEEAEALFSEEALADGFFEYVKAIKARKPAPNTLSQILQDFYQAVLDFLDTMVSPNSARKLYRDLSNRKKTNRKAKDQSIRKFVGEYEKFFAGEPAPLPLVSTRVGGLDSEQTRYYSSPTREKSIGDIQIKHVKEDTQGIYVDEYIVTSGDTVIGTFEDQKEATLFAENAQTLETAKNINYGAVTARFENGNYVITNVEGPRARVLEEEMNLVAQMDPVPNVVIPKKYARGVNLESFALVVEETETDFIVQPNVTQNVQMYKENLDDVYVGVAPSVLGKIDKYDILVIKDFINYANTGEEISKEDFAQAEKMAEALEISMDRGIGKVAQYFTETLQGTRKIPEKALELFNEKKMDTDTELIAEAKKYKSAEEFVSRIRGSGTQYGDYTPNLRHYGMEDYRNISELGVNPEEMVTIYRGLDNVKIKKQINDGDFVTTDFDSAASYSGRDNVVEMEVPAKTLYTDAVRDFSEEPFYTGSEYVYTKQKISPMTKSQLTDIWNKAQGKTEMFNEKEPEKKREMSPEFKKKWESFLVTNGKLQSFGEDIVTKEPEKEFTTTRVNKESKLYKRIKESISELEQTPEYSSTTIADESAKAYMLLEQDKVRAKKIALGQMKKPDDIHIMSIGKAVIADALENKDFKTASEVSAAISVRASEMGSEISMLQKLDHNSTEYWIKRIMQKKKELIEKKYKIPFVEKVKSEKKETKKQINAAFKKEMENFGKEVDSFFAKITC